MHEAKSGESERGSTGSSVGEGPLPFEVHFGRFSFKKCYQKTIKKRNPPKTGPIWPHKASKMSPDEIWGPFWVQNGVQNGPQNGQKIDLAETWIFDTPLEPNQGF